MTNKPRPLSDEELAQVGEISPELKQACRDADHAAPKLVLAYEELVQRLRATVEEREARIAELERKRLEWIREDGSVEILESADQVLGRRRIFAKMLPERTRERDKARAEVERLRGLLQLADEIDSGDAAAQRILDLETRIDSVRDILADMHDSVDDESCLFDGGDGSCFACQAFAALSGNEPETREGE